MPAIKKKWIKASQNGEKLIEPETEDVPDIGDQDRSEPPEILAKPSPKPKKRPAHSSPQGLLRGLDGEVLLEKRARFIPPGEVKLSEWLENNLEKRTEETVYLPHLYKFYVELCQGDGSYIQDITEFSRAVKEKFGKTFGVKETSVYKTLIKEKNINKKKKEAGTGIKLIEIIKEAINHHGNPAGGVRFFALKQYIQYRYPALRIDMRPKLLRRTLENSVYSNKIELVKGIGMAGFYRLPGASEKPSAEKPSAVDQEETANTDGTSELPASEEGKQPEVSADSGEKTEDSEEAKKKKSHKRKKIEKLSFSNWHHGNPKKVEDIFPLAITYQSAPKYSSVSKIRRYILEKYGETLPDARWRKAIDSGTAKGYWEQVSGSGISGSLYLLMDDFNPVSDQTEDRICAAIIACHEPKSASANQIKKYISKYHPEFKVDERPDNFKKALIRAVSKKMIVQLSGLGASGSFQLASSFTPSPSVLAGDNDSSSGEEEADDKEPAYVSKGTKSRGIPKLKIATASPTKSASKKSPKKVSSQKEKSQTPAGGKKSQSATKRAGSSGRKQKNSEASSTSASESEESEGELYVPRKSTKSTSRGDSSVGRTTPKKVKNQTPKRSSKKNKRNSSKTEEENDDSAPETPKAKSNRRAEINEQKQSQSATKSSSAKKSKKAAAAKESKSPTAKAKVTSILKLTKISPKKYVAEETEEDENEEDENEEEAPEYTPTKSKSRGGTPASTPASRKESGSAKAAGIKKGHGKVVRSRK